MNKKLRIVLITLMIGISVSSAQAQNTDKAIGGLGIGFLAKLSNPKFILERLETDPEATTNYFDKNPLNYNPVANVLLPRLKTAQTEDEYNRLYRIAELMGLRPIPPYMGQKSKPTVYTNPKQELSNTDKHIQPNMEGADGVNIIYTPKGKPFDTTTEYPYEEPKNWDEYLLLKQNSTILGINLDKFYQLTDPSWIRPSEVAAHHIIPATHTMAQDARNILKKYGIDINDVVNGVYLPTTDVSLQSGIKHNGKHPDLYVIKVNTDIVNADIIGGEAAVRLRLEQIRNILSNAQKSDNWKTVL